MSKIVYPPTEGLYLPVDNDWEQQYKEYEHEVWSEDPRSWSPLITLQQLAARPDLEIEWYAPDFIPVGAKVILSAEPKTGKTILLFHILNAVCKGGKFLGKQCFQQRVVYLTEQTEHEFKMQINEVPGLMGDPNFFVLLAEEAPKDCITWQGTLAWAQGMLAQLGARILVVDTFGSFAKLPPGGENDSATIQNYINEISFLFKNRYLSVVLTHHNRKKSEDAGKKANLSIAAIRGSSAFAGGGGHVITMDCPEPDSNIRNLNFNGRYMRGDKTLELMKDRTYRELLPLS